MLGVEDTRSQKSKVGRRDVAQGSCKPGPGAVTNPGEGAMADLRMEGSGAPQKRLAASMLWRRRQKTGLSKRLQVAWADS